MPATTHRNGFHPYVVEFRSELERALHSDLFAKFSAVEPEARPWYGAGLAREAANSSGFLIVAPTHIVLAHLFSVPDVSRGVVHGDATPAAWRVETDGAGLLEIDGASSPFAQAREALHFLLPKLDGFLHARKVKNPSVQSVLVFPDGYSFSGVREVPIGPKNRGPISLVTLSEVAQVALSRPQDQALDKAIFREWIKTLVGADDDSTFKFTWLDPAPKTDVTSRAEPQVTPAVSVQDPPGQAVISLTQETDWSFEDRSERGPREFTAEEETLLKAQQLSRASQREHMTGTKRPVRRFLKIAGSMGLILIVLFVAHEIYMYFKPPFPLTPYWQETTPPPSGQTSSETPQATAPAPQAPPLSPTPSTSPTPEVTGPPASETVTAEAAKPENNPAPARSVPSSASPRPSIPADRRVETALGSKPASPGMYETVRSTRALAQPYDSAPVVDPIPPRTRLNVIGSDGAWLIVRSRTRNRTVYVKRDDTAPLSERQARANSENSELKWKEVELQIRAAILERGVPNITVTFIGDTAYLRGTVQTAQEAELAELGAKTIPEVKYVHNGIWVNP